VALPHWLGTNIQAHCNRLDEAGLQPVELCSPEQLIEVQTCVGLLLPGGLDVDPALYGASRDAHTQEPLRARDDFEIALLRESLGAGIPVLAICRGHQLLNVAFGGRLLQHIENSRHDSQEMEAKLVSQAHPVALEPSTRLAALFGVAPLLVNSRHHQAVTQQSLAPGLALAGLTEDGLVEAVEGSSDRWVVGVQWHPERDEPQIPGFAAAGRMLFEAFASAVQAHQT
jgi:putative glutamine amidotransferase